MAVLRAQPYSNQYFTVDIGTGAADAGFAEVVIPGIEIDVLDYRSGNSAGDPKKLPGSVKYGEVTLKRGITGSLALYEWIDQVRNGSTTAARAVTIQLLSDDRTTVVWTWKLAGAFPVKYRGANLNAEGNGLAIEELSLAYERLEIA